jgi:hypothetical protein
MDILVGVHVGGDWNPGVDAAKISLDDASIKRVLKLSRRARRPGEILTVYDSTPDLGTSELDMENQQVKDMARLTEEESQQVVFGILPPDEARSDLVMLHVDGTDFWWEGVFKHTDVHWETRMIPLSFLPQPVVVESGNLAETSMTAEQMNAIHEKIAAGMNHGLNAREIDRTFNRHVTKAQLIRVIMELIERDH